MFDLNSFGTFFFNIIFSIFTGFIDTIFSPIFGGLNGAFGGFITNLLASPVLINFYTVLNNYVIPYVGYFTNWIPPLTWQVLVFSLDLFVVVHVFQFTFGLIFKAMRLLKEFVPLA